MNRSTRFWSSLKIALVAGSAASIIPVFLLLSWFVAELTFLDPPPEGGNGYIRGGFFIFTLSPYFWVISVAWFLALLILKQVTLRRSFTFTMIPCFLFSAFVALIARSAGAPFLVQLELFSFLLTIASGSAAFGSYVFSRMLKSMRNAAFNTNLGDAARPSAG